MDTSSEHFEFQPIGATILYVIIFSAIFFVLYPLFETLVAIFDQNTVYHFIHNIPVLGGFINGLISFGLTVLALFIANWPGLILTDKINHHQEAAMGCTIFATAVVILTLYGIFAAWSLVDGSGVNTGDWLYPLLNGGCLLLYKYAHFD